MMTSSLRALILSAVAALCVSGAAFCAPVTGEPLRDGIDLYKAQHYEDAVKVLETAISENPQSAPARYYLANCYLALAKYDLADQNYALCLKLKPPKDIESFATKMRAKLIAQGLVSASAPAPAPPPPTAAQTEFDKDLADAKERNHQKYSDSVKAQIAEIQGEIDKLKTKLDPQYQNDPASFWKPGPRWNNNPMAQNPQAMVLAKINQLEAQIWNIKNNSKRDMDKADASIEATYADLASQARGGASNIKPVLTNRSLHVRDYVHFTGDEPPPEFVVKPIKLTAGKYVGDKKD
jgi:tetratricopeptide (TPR) repeat protein